MDGSRVSAGDTRITSSNRSPFPRLVDRRAATFHLFGPRKCTDDPSTIAGPNHETTGPVLSRCMRGANVRGCRWVLFCPAAADKYELKTRDFEPHSAPWLIGGREMGHVAPRKRAATRMEAAVCAGCFAFAAETKCHRQSAMLMGLTFSAIFEPLDVDEQRLMARPYGRVATTERLVFAINMFGELFIPSSHPRRPR